MKIFWRSVSLVAVLFAATAGGIHAAQPGGGDPAAGFPGKPIRIVVGFTPGGGSPRIALPAYSTA